MQDVRRETIGYINHEYVTRLIRSLGKSRVGWKSKKMGRAIKLQPESVDVNLFKNIATVHSS